MEQEYFYLDGKDSKGPIQIDQLKALKLKSDTYIWSNHLKDWTKIKDSKDLSFLLITTPPPPPQDVIEIKDVLRTNSSKNALPRLLVWICFHLIALVIAYSNDISSNLIDSRNNQFWPFVSFYTCTQEKAPESEINPNEPTTNKISREPSNGILHKDGTITFDNKGKEIKNKKGRYIPIAAGEPFGVSGFATVEKCRFNGVLYKYDWSEFVIYIIIGIAIFLIPKYSTQ